MRDEEAKRELKKSENRDRRVNSENKNKW